MELPKQPFSIDVAWVKEEYRRAKLSGARNFDVSGKFESFWRYLIVHSIQIWIIGLVQANTIVCSNSNEISNVFILNMMTQTNMYVYE